MWGRELKRGLPSGVVAERSAHLRVPDRHVGSRLLHCLSHVSEKDRVGGLERAPVGRKGVLELLDEAERGRKRPEAFVTHAGGQALTVSGP